MNVGIYATVALIRSNVQLFAEHPVKGQNAPVHAVGFPDMEHRAALGHGGLVVLKSIQDDCRLLRDDLQPLFPVYPVAERAGAGNCRAVLYLAVEHDADALPA